MTNTLLGHSTVATDRPLYHDDTRCPEGGAIALKDRRPGDGGRDPRPYCAGLLVQSIKANLKPRDMRPSGGGRGRPSRSASIPVGFVSASAIVGPPVAVVWLPTMTVAQRVNRVLLLLLCLLAAIGFTWVFAWPW